MLFFLPLCLSARLLSVYFIIKFTLFKYLFLVFKNRSTALSKNLYGFYTKGLDLFKFSRNKILLTLYFYLSDETLFFRGANIV
jgi:hypothetical protein